MSSIRYVGTRHMASAGHYLAAQAALTILENGGNAVDAGVAGGMALGVLQSELVSFGGVAPIILRMADTGQVWTISGLGPWPAKASPAFLREHYGRIPDGLLCTVVPAAPDAWICALKRFGTMSFAEVAHFAIRFAREGFPVSPLMSAIIDNHQDKLSRWPSNEVLYLRDGAPPRPGTHFVNPDLARTIQHMADEEMAASRGGGREAGLEAAHAAFYQGAIAEAICAYHERNGGWLTLEDMASFACDLKPALCTRSHGLDINVGGPWCQGGVLPQAMKILEGFDLAGLGHNSPEYVHVVAEALKLAFADRHYHYGDPKFVDVPMDVLLSDAHARARRAMLSLEKALPGMPGPVLGERAGADVREARADAPQDALDTSFICTVDCNGNVFAATPSDMAVGSPVIPGLGFVPSSRGTQSWLDEDLPAVMAPSKRPRMTPSPVLVQSSDGWLMPIGSPGNDVQLQAVLQVVLNQLVFGMAPQQAAEAPRFASVSFPRSSEPHGYTPNGLMLEARFDAATVSALEQRGHQPQWWDEWDWRAGAVNAIRLDRASGTMEGLADPRRPTGVAGF